MTLGQIWMYFDEDAQEEARIRAGGGRSRIDPKTGHTIVRVDSAEEAAALLERLRKARDAKSQG